MKLSKVLTIGTVLVASSAIYVIEPTQAYAASSTQASLAVENLSEAMPLILADRFERPVLNGSTQQILNRIENRTDRFRDSLDSTLDDSRLNGSNREDNINQFVRDFEEATKDLRDRFDRGQRISDNVQEVLNQASRIDNFIRRQRLSTSVEREWVSLRQDLNELARLSNVARRF